MVILSMSSKRLRRPNVRLWEIGDLSAAFACNISQRNEENLGQNQWITDPYFVQESDYLQSSGQEKSEYCVLDHGTPKIFDEMLQNRENKDPNSLIAVSQTTSSMNRNKLDFGTITRKSRLMRRRRQSPTSICSVFGGRWNWDTSFDMYHAHGFKDSSERATPSDIKEACEVEIDDHEFSMEIPQKPNEFGSNGDTYEDNTAFNQSTNGINKKVMHGANENGVREWLEELGFAKFSEMFEMHEVDEEALPLLTFGDLKEMGIVAVGPRRKLFSAIQQLKGGQ